MDYLVFSADQPIWTFCTIRGIFIYVKTYNFRFLLEPEILALVECLLSLFTGMLASLTYSINNISVTTNSNLIVICPIPSLWNTQLSKVILDDSLHTSRDSPTMDEFSDPTSSMLVRDMGSSYRLMVMLIRQMKYYLNSD